MSAQSYEFNPEQPYATTPGSNGPEPAYMYYPAGSPVSAQADGQVAQAVEAALGAVSYEEPAQPADDEIDLYADAEYDSSGPVLDPVKHYLRQIGRVPLLNAEQEVALSKRIEAGVYAAHLLERLRETESGAMPGATRPTRQETTPDSGKPVEHSEADLAAIAADGQRAMDHMTEANLRLVVSIAKRYQSKGLDLLELIQEGNLGLMHAIEKFDYAKGYKFSTYATWWLRQTMTRAISDKARTIRLPVHMVETVNKLNRLKREYLTATGEDASIDHLAREMSLTPAKIKELLEVGQDVISLQAPTGSDPDASELQYFIADNEGVDAFEAAASEDLRKRMAMIINAVLPSRAALVISMRYGLHGGQPATLDAVGKEIGLTRERIRQIERDAMFKLKTSSEASELHAFLTD